jgi:hypothetical protein
VYQLISQYKGRGEYPARKRSGKNVSQSIKEPSRTIVYLGRLEKFLANVFHTSHTNLFIMAGQEISVNIPPTLDPVYSNMIQIAYKDDEFTFMFLHQLPQVNQARAKAIVSITPAHAKNLLGVLTKTVADYELKFGTISAPKETQGTEKVSTLSGYS